MQISGDADGRVNIRMIERLTRTYVGTLRSDGSFSASGTGSLGSYNYEGQISGQVSGNSVQGSERLSFNSGCPDRQVEYRFTGNR